MIEASVWNVNPFNGRACGLTRNGSSIHSAAFRVGMRCDRISSWSAVNATRGKAERLKHHENQP